ncbi:hypothetical protein DFP72DRAFT_859382 [Ephemerocybe angulata]|uniref:Uncharacterized protein n=1 Tax=Ephemerocybe angulata TaxID=980116 RepID=A0A8H6HBQ3_9AGAR|nr:hypothetical protein DFP72DRAFT_859382 [Tulosesus angulatus]
MDSDHYLSRFAGSDEKPFPNDVQNVVMSYLSLRDLKALREVDALGEAIRDHLRSRVARMLASFGLDGSSTLKVMKTSNTVISGSAALEIVVPGACKPNDLNLYCPRGKSSEMIVHLLRNHYILVGETPSAHEVAEGCTNHHYPARNGVRQLFRFSHTTHPFTLTLVESISESPLLPILFFHSTYVMNYCSSTEVACLYPEMTHDAKGLHNRSEAFDFLHKRETLRRWDDCGIDLVWNCELWHSEHYSKRASRRHPGECQRVVRSIHDDTTLRIGYDRGSSIPSNESRVEWRLGFFDLKARGVEHHDTQVLTFGSGPPRRYTNNKRSHRCLDWDTFWEFTNMNTKVVQGARAGSFP